MNTTDTPTPDSFGGEDAPLGTMAKAQPTPAAERAADDPLRYFPDNHWELEALTPAAAPPASETPTPLTKYGTRGGEIWEMVDGEWRELFARDAVVRFEELRKQLAEAFRERDEYKRAAIERRQECDELRKAIGAKCDDTHIEALKICQQLTAARALADRMGEALEGLMPSVMSHSNPKSPIEIAKRIARAALAEWEKAK